MVDDFICIKDFETLATRKLSRNAKGFFNSGATDEQTLQENHLAFKAWRFRPLVLRDVSTVDTTTTVLGNNLPFPVCTAPTGMSKLAFADGELAVAKAASSHKICFALSTGATTSIEEIASHVPLVLRWFQLYIYKDRELVKQMVQRAEENGFRALIVTVDTPVLGRRYQDLRNKFIPPSNITLKNFEGLSKDGNFSNAAKLARNSSFAEFVASLQDSAVTWKDIDWLKTITNLPIVVKGVLTAEMAIECLDHGVAGILVSNHGGRQLDGVSATINALSQVIKAVNGRCEVYLDGGVRNGGDIAKAIALGARAVFVGRPIIWGLACHGEAGVAKVLEILRDEFKLTMKLLGVTSIKELQTLPNLVVHAKSSCSRV